MPPKGANLLEYSEQGRNILSKFSSAPLEGFATHSVDVSISEFMKDSNTTVEKGRDYLLWHLINVEEVLQDIAENAIISAATDKGLKYVSEEGGTALDIDISDRDKLFKDAAEIIVIAQQGSASLLQRKLKLGYNRAGRIIDQMEAAGVVGPFEGSKARQVLVSDFAALDRLLNDEEN